MFRREAGTNDGNSEDMNRQQQEYVVHAIYDEFKSIRQPISPNQVKIRIDDVMSDFLKHSPTLYQYMFI